MEKKRTKPPETLYCLRLTREHTHRSSVLLQCLPTILHHPLTLTTSPPSAPPPRSLISPLPSPYPSQTHTQGIIYFPTPFALIILQRWPRLHLPITATDHNLLPTSLLSASFANRVNHLIVTQGAIIGLSTTCCYTPLVFHLDRRMVHSAQGTSVRHFMGRNQAGRNHDTAPHEPEEPGKIWIPDDVENPGRDCHESNQKVRDVPRSK